MTGSRTRVFAVAVAALLLASGCQQSLEERLVDVRALHELGAWEESVEELREILQEHPDDPEANHLLGVAQLQLGQPSLAVWPLQMARRDPEVAVEADLALAAAYVQLEQTEPALEAIGRVLESEAASAENQLGALRLRAGANLARREWEQALADAERILEREPGDRSALTIRSNALVQMGRAEEASETLREIWANASPDNARAAVQAGIGLVQLHETQLDDPEAAERQLREVLERHPAQRDVLRFAVGFYDRRGESERAEEVLTGALEASPQDLAVRTLVAEQMARRGRAEEGEAVLVEATELVGSAQAWLALADYREERGDAEGAVEAIERTVELVPEPTDMLRFKRADLLANAGRLDEARQRAEELPDSVYRDVMLGRLAFERGEYAEALERLDQGLRRWPNNPGARYLAGRSALALGDVDRAIAELREAVRANPGATDAGVLLARIRLARGEPRMAADILGKTLSNLDASGPRFAALGPRESERSRQALALYARAQFRTGKPKKAFQELARLASIPGGRLLATVELGALVAELQGPGEAADRMLGVELDFTDPAHVEALRALAQYLVEADRQEEALEKVQAALAAHPDLPVLHDVHGRVLFNAGRPEEARTAFERALELEPELAPALEGLAGIARAEGDPARARELLTRAAQADPASAAYPYGLARIALAEGDLAAAEAPLREALSREPLHAEANNDLAWVLAQRGESLDEALTHARRAVAGLRSANAMDTLGWVQLRRGEAQEAAETLGRAHELDPDSPSIAYRLSLALVETGDPDRARELLRRALDTGGFPEAEQAREQLARLEAASS